ncbi:MAG: hypothetical protein H0X26_10260 [Alphaproteobacteria bacterium]|nr:hypothetical protein [Alphaproteobacteria bacterium]
MAIPWNFTRCYNLEEWEEIIADWEESGQTKPVYCKKQGITYRTFLVWEKKIHSSTFLPRQEIEERWRKVIKDWEKSGLSKYEYCRAKKLSQGVFYRMERRFNPHSVKRANPIEVITRWAVIVADWEKSGLNKFAYCKKNGVADYALRSWVKRLDFLKTSERYADFLRKLQIETLPENLDLSSLEEGNVIDSLPISQKIEVTFSQGERFCLEGPFDWPKLMAWLTPLLTR